MAENFKLWLNSQDFFIKKNSVNGIETHLLLDGGRLCVPDSKNAEFLSKYAKAVFNCERVYVVEKKSTPAFCMMAELDIKIHDREISREEISFLITAIQSGVMSLAFPATDVRVGVFTAASKAAVLADGRRAVQSGIHLHWPNVPVDIRTARKLRSWIVQVASATGISIDVPWAEAVDPCIFHKNGIRMIGSRKMELCSNCKGKSISKNDACAKCYATGRVDAGRPYSLLYVADRHGVADEEETRRLSESILETVLFSSIRTASPALQASPVLSAIDDCVDPPQLHHHKTNLRFAEPSDRQQVDPQLANFILTEFSGHPIVSEVIRGCRGAVYLAKTSCRYCENKKGEHNSSTVYFVIKHAGVVQRCFSRKNCVGYASRIKRLPKDLVEKMFPNQKKSLLVPINNKFDLSVAVKTAYFF